MTSADASADGSSLSPAATGQDSQAGPQARLIRLFLSSTFRDFLQERELLAKRVFPALNRRARERGVELVEVDLRWGVTQTQAEDGHALEICLKQIERCKPYFIGMLGDSYGSLTPSTQQLLKAAPELLTQRSWLAGQLGQASYTDLEIAHSLQLLQDPAMEGRAFFYFRDPAYSAPMAQAGQPGWSSTSPHERQKLEQLKHRIRQSPYPVVEDLADPEAIANRIEADLWALIDRQFPEGEQPDALEREDRKHADYRRSRTGEGQYIGGEAYIQQLEQWIASGEQQILITGLSGAGKSALIANWMEAHATSHPNDVLYAHHLGCTNDANALRPLLARLIQNASRHLIAEEVITEELPIPENWWELVAAMKATLEALGNWAQQNGRRWIWVLDGLDRLDQDDQKALPWLPEKLPAGVQVVATALQCQARDILTRRQFTTFTIEQLQRQEQQQLIDKILGRYTKQLDPALQEQILSHPLAGSPLFLRVLLEELRQCGRFDTLAQQLGSYLNVATIDDLYERVLERLETDGHGDAVEKVMTALWASRAGLTETELLAITGLAPLEWAPIDLALEKAFGRNGNRLVFDHDFLRIAVQDRYLPTDEARREAHGALADWHEAKDEWDERDAEELPWQWQQAGRLGDLREHLLDSSHLAHLVEYRGSREVINYWLAARAEDDGELDELLAGDLEQEIEKRREDPEDLIWFVDRIADLYNEAGLYREPLIKLRALSLELEEASEERSEESMLSSLQWLADAHRDLGNYDDALPLYRRCLEARERLLGPEHPSTLTTVANLGLLYKDKGDYEKAEAFFNRALEARERLLGPEHPSTLITVANLGILYKDKGDYEKAEAFFNRDLEASERLLGPEHPSTLTTVANLGLLYKDMGDYEKAEAFYNRALEASERLLGPEHPSTLTTVANLGILYKDKGDYEKAEAFYNRALEASERLLGPEHPSTLTTVANLGLLYQDMGDYEKAEAFFNRDLEASERLLGPEHPSTLTTVANLGLLYKDMGDYEKAEAFYNRALEASERLLGPEHPSTLITVANLGILYKDKGDYEKAEAFFNRDLEASERLLGPEHPSTLTTVANLGLLYQDMGDYEQAEAFFNRALQARERLLGPEHPHTNGTRYSLANLLSEQERYAESIPLRRLELEIATKRDGREAEGTLTSINQLAIDLRETGELEEAEALFRELVTARQQVLEPGDFDIGRALGGLAKTLEMAGKLEEALSYAQQALDHRSEHEGPDAWWTNLERLDLARVLQKLSRNQEAIALLELLHTSMDRTSEPDDDDRQLLKEAVALQHSLQQNPT